MVVAFSKLIPEIIVEVVAGREVTKEFVVVTAEDTDFAIQHNYCVSDVLAQLDNELVLHKKFYLHHRECAVRERDVNVAHIVFEKNAFLDGLCKPREKNI
jgi:hypothetical protein